MPVLDTRTWMYDFLKACKEQHLKNPYFIQCDVLCSSLKNLFPDISVEELHYHLLTIGLFEPSEWKDVEQTVYRMEKSSMWELVSQEYERLKRKWNGPEIPIIIFPIRNAHLTRNKNTVSKNGAAFKEAIFLFLSPDLQKEEIMALLAHEYNHVCRLAYLGKDEKQLSLKEALIIEGFGEFAVKELYGEKWLAPWINFYSFDETVEIWKKKFIPSLNIVGKEKYDVFLYGKNNRNLPKWIGYHIGFQIVDSFHSLYGPFKDGGLYTKTADEVIAGSTFRYES
ncbi:MAG: DUF2268 domain-containing putative Zn-dependent protease [Domibacillus tundrae]